jgi:hypothetical protein
MLASDRCSPSFANWTRSANEFSPATAVAENIIVITTKIKRNIWFSYKKFEQIIPYFNRLTSHKVTA